MVLIKLESLKLFKIVDYKFMFIVTKGKLSEKLNRARESDIIVKAAESIGK